MKRVEELVHEALTAEVHIVNGRVYPIIMPQDTKKVSVVYSVITNFDRDCMLGDTFRNEVHLQVDVFAPTFKESLAARDQVKYAMKKAFKVYDFFTTSLFEPITTKYRQVCDMRISAEPFSYIPPHTGSNTIDSTSIHIDSTTITIDMV